MYPKKSSHNIRFDLFIEKILIEEADMFIEILNRLK